MRRFIASSILIALFSVVGLVAAPSAHAGLRVGGTLRGQDVFPEDVQFLREAREWKRAADADYAHARANGDVETMRYLQHEWALLERDVDYAKTRLRTARTTVYRYGDAGQRLSANDVVELLRSTGAWRHGTVHFWYERGELFWATKGPRRYDNSAWRQSSVKDVPTPSASGGDNGRTRTFDWSQRGRDERRRKRQHQGVFGIR